MNDNTSYPMFRWFVLFVLCFLTATTSVLMISPAPMVGVIAKHMGIHIGSVTAGYMGIFNFVSAFSCIAGGFLCDRFGYGRVLLWSSIVMLVSTIPWPFIGTNFEAGLVLRILQAIGVGPIFATAIPIAIQWFPPKQRAYVMGFRGASISLGIAVGVLLVPMLLKITGDWQSTIAWMAVTCVVSLLISILVLVGPKAPVAVVQDQTVNPEDDHLFRRALRRGVFWVGVIICCSTAWTVMGYNDLVPGFMSIDPPIGLGLGMAVAGKYMAVKQLAYVIGAIVVGFILEKIFRGNNRGLISTAFVITFVSTLVMMTPLVHENPNFLLGCVVIIGFAQSMIFPTTFVFIANNYPASIAGRTQGIWFGVGNLASSVSVIVSGMALKFTGSYTIPIIIIAATCLLGAIITPILRAPKLD